MATYIRHELSVDFLISGQVDGGTVSSNIEDCIVVTGADLGKLFGLGELLLYDRVIEKFRRCFVSIRLGLSEEWGV